MKYSKGPWRILAPVGWTSDSPVYIAALDGLGDFISGKIKLETEEQKANAALISAAPDMYEALKELLSLEASPNVSGWERVAKAYGLARAAIEKAEGKA